MKRTVEPTLVPSITNGPVRFAVGRPDGISSSSWRCWVEKRGDIYIACRDNFQACKVSLHASGRWRMGFTAEAQKKYKHLLPENLNRAWDVWDEPKQQLPGAVIAFHLFFPTSELAIMPHQRKPDKWKDTIFIHAHDNYGHLSAEPAPPGKMIAVTLSVVEGNQQVNFESEPSVYLASFDIGNDRRAQLIAHGIPEGDIHKQINEMLSEALSQARKAGKGPPPQQGISLDGIRSAPVTWSEPN